MAQIDKFLETALKQRSSDLHLASGELPRARIDGELVPISDTVLSPENVQELLFEMLSEEDRERLIKNKNLDKSYTLAGVGFFRVNMYFTRRGLSAVLRTIPTKIPSMADLKLPESVKQLADAAKGLVLVTGPTGSGKSTTLAAMIDYLNTNFNYHILTCEDPVEFVHPTKKSLINQREIGTSCPSFSDALKYALREDPDVILVGEMRDLETIGLAITAAETGHLVFGTLHTRGAGASVDRIIDSFPANQQGMIRAMLSESLVGVVSQTLLKRQDQPGRVAAFEILVTNHAISNLIREGKTFQIPSIMQTSKKEGMVLMDQNILELVEKGIVSVEEATPYMDNPAVLNGKGKPATTLNITASAATPPPSPAAPKTGAPPSVPTSARPPSGPPKMATPSMPTMPSAAPVAAAVTPPLAAPKPAAPSPAVPAPVVAAPVVAPPAPATPVARPLVRDLMPAPTVAPITEALPTEPNLVSDETDNLHSLNEASANVQVNEGEIVDANDSGITDLSGLLGEDDSLKNELLDVSIGSEDSDDGAEPTVAYALPRRAPAVQVAPAKTAAAAAPAPVKPLVPRPSVPVPSGGASASKRVAPPPPPPPINKKTG